jgi:hypothetical protein
VPASAAPVAHAQVTIYLNRDGGVFTPGEPNDSRSNVSSVPDTPVDLPAWDGDDTAWGEVVSCVRDLFAPFDAEITDVDPSTESHFEVVVGGLPQQLGLDANAAGVSPFRTDCSIINNSIVFVFPDVLDDNRRICEAIAQEVAHSFGLDHEYLCEDPMTYLTGCGDKRFLFRDAICGELSARECKCSRSQNSARMLLERLGSGSRPTLWISDPTGEDPVAKDALVRAAVTNQPGFIDLYVDGVIIDNAPPVTGSDPYAVVELATFGTLEPGTHELTVVARWDDMESTETVQVEVLDPDADNDLIGGCSGSGGGLVLLVAFSGIRRRRRPAS